MTVDNHQRWTDLLFIPLVPPFLLLIWIVYGPIGDRLIALEQRIHGDRVAR